MLNHLVPLSWRFGANWRQKRRFFVFRFSGLARGEILTNLETPKFCYEVTLSENWNGAKVPACSTDSKKVQCSRGLFPSSGRKTQKRHFRLLFLSSFDKSIPLRLFEVRFKRCSGRLIDFFHFIRCQWFSKNYKKALVNFFVRPTLTPPGGDAKKRRLLPF